jgi:hypothetical protein
MRTNWIPEIQHVIDIRLAGKLIFISVLSLIQAESLRAALMVPWTQCERKIRDCT